MRPARTPDGEDTPAWRLELARQELREEAEAIPFGPLPAAEPPAPTIELEAPATPETKMQDLAAPAQRLKALASTP